MLLFTTIIGLAVGKSFALSIFQVYTGDIVRLENITT